MKNLFPVWEGIRKGNEQAFEFLFNATFRQLCAYAYGIVRDRQLAEEIVHDVFINLWTKKNEIVINDSVSSYLYKSVRNLSLNYLRRQKTHKHSIETKAGDEVWSILMETYRINAEIIERMEASETEEIIFRAVEELPEQCRLIFQMSRNEGLENSEISAKLDISVNTVRTQLFRALTKIRQKLSEKFPGLL